MLHVKSAVCTDNSQYPNQMPLSVAPNLDLQPCSGTQSTLVISNSKGLAEKLWDIRISKYQSCRSEENNKSNNHI